MLIRDGSFLDDVFLVSRAVLFRVQMKWAVS